VPAVNFTDPAWGCWNAEIFHGRNGAPTLRQFRERHLTPEEIVTLEAQEREPL
jgi:hypothetical protein